MRKASISSIFVISLLSACSEKEAPNSPKTPPKTAAKASNPASHTPLEDEKRFINEEAKLTQVPDRHLNALIKGETSLTMNDLYKHWGTPSVPVDAGGPGLTVCYMGETDKFGYFVDLHHGASGGDPFSSNLDAEKEHKLWATTKIAQIRRIGTDSFEIAWQSEAFAEEEREREAKWEKRRRRWQLVHGVGVGNTADNPFSNTDNCDTSPSYILEVYQPNSPAHARLIHDNSSTSLVIKLEENIPKDTQITFKADGQLLKNIEFDIEECTIKFKNSLEVAHQLFDRSALIAQVGGKEYTFNIIGTREQFDKMTAGITERMQRWFFDISHPFGDDEGDDEGSETRSLHLLAKDAKTRLGIYRTKSDLHASFTLRFEQEEAKNLRLSIDGKPVDATWAVHDIVADLKNPKAFVEQLKGAKSMELTIDGVKTTFDVTGANEALERLFAK